ncbi:uncharacterized protein EDB91DRAFT_1256074 [Suillus paluster]|uniref:uncharacterized protein n=1 Tax=Suillus paluster TaxID=48578 RepID=UPI001B861F7D|nr:uncharacterized protein EDB91DRAFT_1256074 [Suillus paluster]KAG1722452.1 hypothetical protein EDB91DRAFT_1256074 [Suillus paluster]
MTYQRLRQICNSDYVVGNFTAITPGDRCNDEVGDCCCNSVAFALSMLCMNCQLDADPSGNAVGITAVPGDYGTYLGGCSPITDQSLPSIVQQAVCNENIKIDNFLYNRSYWSDGSWFYRWTVEYAQEQQIANNNNTFTVCPNQVSPSASLPTSTSVPTTTLAGIGAASAVPSSSANSTSSSAQGAIIGGAVGGVAFAIIAVLGGVFYYRRHKKPRMIQDTPSSFLGQFPDNQLVLWSVLHGYRTSLSPVRRSHGYRESTLPMTHSLSPERGQSLNTSTGASYLMNDSVSEAALYSREDDAGTLIPPDDAPAHRLPPAYHPSWVTRNSAATQLRPLVKVV